MTVIKTDIRWADNTADLKRNLLDGLDVINAMKQSADRLTASMGGEGLFRSANNLVAAITQLGGVTKLTSAEQDRANATLDKAIEKYQAMGKTAPTALVAMSEATRKLTDEDMGRFVVKASDVETATKRMGVEHSALSETLVSVAQGFAAMFTARAAFNFVSETIEEASALKALSQQTHIGVEDLQLMSGAMSEFKVDAETLGKGLYQLSRGIAGGDDSVATGLHMMGLSLKDVEGLNGKDLFLKIMSGLATLQGGLRDTAAAELFGGKLGAAMAGASEGINGTLATWQRLNHVASSESIDALDQYGSAIERMKKSLNAMATDMIGPVAQGFNVLTDASSKGASKWAIAVAMVKDWAASNIVTGASTSNLATLLDHLNTQTEANTKVTETSTTTHTIAAAALDAHGRAARFMASLELDAAEPLLAWQKEYLDQLAARGALDAKTAAAIGVNVQQLNAYQANLKGTADALRILSDIEAEEDAVSTLLYANKIRQLAEVTKANLGAYSFEAQIAALEQLDAAEQVLAVDVEHSLHSEQERAKVRADAARQHQDILNQEMELQKKHADVVNAAILRELDAQTKLNAAWGLDAAGAIKVQKTALDILTEKMDDLHREKVEGISQSAEEQVLIDEYTASLYADAVAQDVKTAALDRSNAVTEQAIDGLHRLQMASASATIPQDATNPYPNTIEGHLAMLAAQQAQNPSVFINASGLFAGLNGHADGIMNAPGGWSVVGERGAELMYVPQGADIYKNGTGPRVESSGAGLTQPRVIQLVVDRRVLASVLDDGTMDRHRNTGGR